MPGLNQMADSQAETGLGLNSFPPVWSVGVDDYVLLARWSADSQFLAVLPSDRAPVIFDRDGREVVKCPEHKGGNGSLAWHPEKSLLAIYGQDGMVRVWDMNNPQEGSAIWKAGSGWAEHVGWNADGTLVAAAVGRELVVWDVATGEERQRWQAHKSTICHFTWNPANPQEVATVGEGGARMWRVGKEKPYAQFDWGGASLRCAWSPDGRWLVTADQTPSVHLYDFSRREPLHIQGFDAKVKALAWGGKGELLVTSNGADLAVWPCTGRRGPDGATPQIYSAHRAMVTDVAFCGATHILVTGDQDGVVLLWSIAQSENPALLGRAVGKISSLAWSPDERSLAQADATGAVTVCRLPERK